MTETEFFRNALLHFAGNSEYCPTNWADTENWKKEIESAAAALLDVAIENSCLEADEPDKPP